MARPSAVLAVVASGLLLAGCAAAPELPRPMTYGEAKKQVAEQNLQWWQSIFPGEPMPEIEPIEFREPGVADTLVQDCLKAANIPGLRFDDSGGWSYTSNGGGGGTEFDRAQFVCNLQYPYDVSDPSKLGMLTQEEKAWIWEYNRGRLVPCLQLLGYSVPQRSGDYSPNDYWNPYFEMMPLPSDAGEWARIDLRCPHSPVGPSFRPALLP